MYPTLPLLALLCSGSILGAQDSSDRTADGWHHYERGEYDQAKKKFREALRKNGEDTSAKAGSGWCLFRIGRLSEAEKTFRQILEKNGNEASALQGIAAVTQKRWATLTLASTLASQGYSDQALLLYDRIIRKRDHDFPVEETWRARLGKAWCLYWRGDYSDAEDNFERVLTERETEPTAMQGLGYALYRRGKYDDAREQFEKTLQVHPGWFEIVDNLAWCELKEGNLREASARFGEAIKLSPTTADSHAGAAWVCHKWGRMLDALSHFRDAIALNPRYVEDDEFRKLLLKEREYRELYLPLGEAYLALGEYGSAIARLNSAIRWEDTLRVRANLAYAQLQSRKYDDVISTLDTLASTPPSEEEITWRNATSTLGWAHYHDGNPRRAARIFKRIDAQSAIGWCLFQQGKLDEAKVVFEKVLEETPGEMLAVSGLSGIQSKRRSDLDTAWQEFYTGQYDKALSSFKKALSGPLPRKHAWESRLGLGWCHLKKEAYESAEKELREARYEALNASDPATARATVKIATGWTRFGKEEYEKAIGDFENARETFPLNVDVCRGLGWSLLRMGRKEEALHAFQQGLNISPWDPGCSEGIAFLQSDKMDK